MNKIIFGRAIEIKSKYSNSCVVIMHTLLIYFRAREMSKERSGAGEERERERSLIGAETQLFRLSRDRNRIQRGSFRPRTGPSRDVIVTRHLSPSSVSSAALRAGDFFLFRVKTFSNERNEREGEGRGEGRLSIGVARSNVASLARFHKLEASEERAPTRRDATLGLYASFPFCFSLVILDG